MLKKLSTAESSTEQKNQKFEALDKEQLVTDNFLSFLRSGTIPWREPWVSQQCLNVVTGKHFHGFNILFAVVDARLKKYPSTLYAGMQQGKQKFGWGLKKGSKATWMRYPRIVDKEDEDGNIVPTVIGFGWCKVFNIATFDDSKAKTKIDDVADNYGNVKQIIPDEARTQRLIDSQNADIRFGGAEVVYLPGADQIQLPRYGKFSNVEAYQASCLHALVHWTGHLSRLNRQNSGQSSKAFEELVADLGAAFICQSLGVTPDLEHHQSFVDEWIALLKADKNAIFAAVAAAHKAVNLLMGAAHLLEDEPEEDLAA